MPKPAKRTPVSSRTVAYNNNDNNDGLPRLRPLDERIRQLNHRGNSAGQISKILKSDPEAQGENGKGWGIGKSAVGDRIKEMRMDPRNKIRANFKKVGGTPSEQKKWYKVMLWLRDYSKQYQKRNGFKISLRTAYYDATDLKIVKDTEYDAFVKNATDARIGYPDQDGNLLLPKYPWMLSQMTAVY